MSSKCGMKGGRSRAARRQRGRQQRGGMNSPSNSYSDAASFVKAQVGDGNQQWDNVFIKGGMNGNQIQSLDGSQPSSVLSTNLSKLPNMTGGRGRGRTMRRSRQQRRGRTMHRQRGQSRSRRGGFFGSVLEQAIVPFGLLAAQNRYAKRTRKHRK